MGFSSDIRFYICYENPHGIAQNTRDSNGNFKILCCINAKFYVAQNKKTDWDPIKAICFENVKYLLQAVKPS